MARAVYQRRLDVGDSSGRRRDSRPKRFKSVPKASRSSSSKKTSGSRCRPVSVGQTNEGEAVITKGIAVGEQVVREGQFLLSPGSRVDIKDPAKVADETKGEGRRRGGRGKAKADGEGKETASAGEPVKGEGRRERKAAEGEVREAAKAGEDSKAMASADAAAKARESRWRSPRQRRIAR